uniref:Uncharacterized protein n=1 Tax=Strongyloides venezuelensis TaxID=75913 RepID=A0A0K0FIS1_STRVS
MFYLNSIFLFVVCFLIRGISSNHPKDLYSKSLRNHNSRQDNQIMVANDLNDSIRKVFLNDDTGNEMVREKRQTRGPRRPQKKQLTPRQRRFRAKQRQEAQRAKIRKQQRLRQIRQRQRIQTQRRLRQQRLQKQRLQRQAAERRRRERQKQAEKRRRERQKKRLSTTRRTTTTAKATTTTQATEAPAESGDGVEPINEEYEVPPEYEENEEIPDYGDEQPLDEGQYEDNAENNYADDGNSK